MPKKINPSGGKGPKEQSEFDFTGFADKSGPEDSIDLSDDKDELIQEAENESNVATSTPFGTPAHSPDRLACIESNSVQKSRELFEGLDKSDSKVGTKVASKLVVPTSAGNISPVRPLGVTNNSIEAKTKASTMGVDEETATRYCETLKQVVDSATADVLKAKKLFSSDQIDAVKIRAMQSRLKSWIERLEKYEKQVLTYKGKSVDTSIVIMQSEDVKMDLHEYYVVCDEYIKTIVEKEPKGPVLAGGAKIVKTVPSKFPEFDGDIDFDIWETNWKQLANNSGLAEDGLIIKLRESLVGKVKDYIGVNGMSSLTYNQTWEKLKERYAVPWVKTQRASRKYFSIPPPEDDDESIVRYIDAVRDAVDTVETAALQPEHILFNIALDNLPERVRVPLAEKLEVDCPDFKFSKAIFEKQFSKIMSLLKSKSRHPTTSMYLIHVNENAPNKENSGKSDFVQNKDQHQGYQRGAHGGRGRGRGRGRGSTQYNGNGNQSVPTCMLCAPQKHYRKDCIYKTPQQKRERLVSIGRCQACATILREHGIDCTHKARCPDHPSERHLPWTCDGKDTVHPGPQPQIPSQPPVPSS